MIVILALIVGIICAVRRPKFSRLTSQDFPGVEAAKFSEWQSAELRSIDISIWTCCIAFLIALFTAGMTYYLMIQGAVFSLIILAVGLIVAAIYGGKAKELRMAAGIKWPK